MDSFDISSENKIKVPVDNLFKRSRSRVIQMKISRISDPVKVVSKLIKIFNHNKVKEFNEVGWFFLKTEKQGDIFYYI